MECKKNFINKNINSIIKLKISEILETKERINITNVQSYPLILNLERSYYKKDVLILGDLLAQEKLLFDVLNKFKARRIERISWVIDTSNKIIRLAEMGKSVFGRFIRNMIIKFTGPQNVIGWRKLLKNKVI